MTPVLWYLPVLLAGVCFLLLDIYTDNRLLERWAKQVRPAHVKKACVYLIAGVLAYWGLLGVASIPVHLADLHTARWQWPTSMGAGILAELAAFGYELRRRR